MWRRFIAAWDGRRAWRSTPQGNLYVAASLGGRRGVVRITPDAQSGAVSLRAGDRRPGVFAVEVA